MADDRDEDAGILVLRHQTGVLGRQLAGTKVRFAPPGRAVLAALRHRLRPETVRRMGLLVRPGTVPRWRRGLVKGRHAARPQHERAGRPPAVRSVRARVLRRVRQNPGWGDRRVHGGLLVPGVTAAASTVGEILTGAGIGPAPRTHLQHVGRFSSVHQQMPCWRADYFEAVTLAGTRRCGRAVIAHRTRRIRVLGAAAHRPPRGGPKPPGTWSWTFRTPAAGRGP